LDYKMFLSRNAQSSTLIVGGFS